MTILKGRKNMDTIKIKGYCSLKDGRNKDFIERTKELLELRSFPCLLILISVYLDILTKEKYGDSSRGSFGLYFKENFPSFCNGVISQLDFYDYFRTGILTDFQITGGCCIAENSEMNGATCALTYNEEKNKEYKTLNIELLAVAFIDHMENL